MKMIKKYPFSCLLFCLLLLTSRSFAQIGEVQTQNRTLVGSVGSQGLTLPYLEYVEIDKGSSSHYNLWYKNADDPREAVRNIQFYASDFELEYLRSVFRAGFSMQLQRLEVGEERLVITRPRRSGEPMRVRIYYSDGSTGSFYLSEAETANLFGNLKEDPITYRSR